MCTPTPTLHICARATREGRAGSETYCRLQAQGSGTDHPGPDARARAHGNGIRCAIGAKLGFHLTGIVDWVRSEYTASGSKGDTACELICSNNAYDTLQVGKQLPLSLSRTGSNLSLSASYQVKTSLTGVFT